ncbi:MAG: polyhydroxybutyrate depolymerase [Mycobacterium sp.]|nr:polyhydroxybutyrate depolymerase [Mycobacterium sp.]
MRLIAILASLSLVIGCSVIEDFLVPSHRYTFSYDGMERTYRLYEPKGLPQNAPLVVMLHGLYGRSAPVEGSMKWDKQADAYKFKVAYPDGVGHSWNAHGCCGEAAEKNINDIGFLTAMVNRIPGVDRTRVYAAGMSNGGMMAYTLACTTDVFAAIGPVASTQVDTCRNPHPTSVLAYHNLDDATVPFSGTPKGGEFRVDAPPVNDVIEGWRRVDACGPPVVTVVAPRTTSTATCADNREIELITNADGGHAWPTDFEAGLWTFFAQHSK